MIAESRPNDDDARRATTEESVEPPRANEVQVAGQRDVVMMARAIREDWPMTLEQRQATIDELMKVVKDSKRGRDKVRAALALIAADRANISAEKKPTLHQHLHVEGQGAPTSGQVEDAGYIEYLAARGAPDHLQPGLPGTMGHGWALGALSTPAASKPPAHGSGS